MLYELVSPEAALEALEEKRLSAANTIQFLVTEGYIPNKNKSIILSWTTVMLHAYKNIDIFSDEQKEKLNILYTRLKNI